MSFVKRPSIALLAKKKLYYTDTNPLHATFELVSNCDPFVLVAAVSAERGLRRR
jgi:hypothetical protein